MDDFWLWLLLDKNVGGAVMARAVQFIAMKSSTAVEVLRTFEDFRYVAEADPQMVEIFNENNDYSACFRTRSSEGLAAGSATQQIPLTCLGHSDINFNWIRAIMNTVQAKNTILSVRVVGLLALVFIIGTQAATAQEPAKVLLLLHGMNSSPDTWNDFVALKFNNSCAIIANGVLTDNSTPNPQGVLCYRIRFGSFDVSSGRVGLRG